METFSRYKPSNILVILALCSYTVRNIVKRVLNIYYLIYTHIVYLAVYI